MWLAEAWFNKAKHTRAACLVFAYHKNITFTVYSSVSWSKSASEGKHRQAGWSLLSEPERLPKTPTHSPLQRTQVLPLRLRLCWMVAWRGGGGGRGRGRDCREAPITLTRKGPGCGPPISSGREQEGGIRARRIRRWNRSRNGTVHRSNTCLCLMRPVVRCGGLKKHYIHQSTAWTFIDTDWSTVNSKLDFNKIKSYILQSHTKENT